MKKYKLAVIGFGNVGQGLTQVINEKHKLLAEQFDIELSIVAVCDSFKGSVADPEGLDPKRLLSDIKAFGHLKNTAAPIKGWNALETINNSGADILIELAFTDLNTAEPALTHIKEALMKGMHVSMTNKGPVTLHLPELQKLAMSNNVQLGIEGTVMSGTPALHLGKNMLVAAGITKIQGILNGTTNYMLEEMASGADYESALQRAQQKGYAEAEPSGDVDGHDAAAKVVILGNYLMGLDMTLNDVERIGITKITENDISYASKIDKQWKLIASVEKTDTGFLASVKPQLLSNEHPLAAIKGATNAITYATELLGDVTLIGPGAGIVETGYAVIEDILSIHNNTNRKAIG